jgi:hypothetical protein
MSYRAGAPLGGDASTANANGGRCMNVNVEIWIEEAAA